MSHFVAYHDKENSQLRVLGQLGHGPLGGARPKAGPIGKSFQANSLGKASHSQRKTVDGSSISASRVDPSNRKALGGLNISPTKRTNKPKGNSQNVFLKPPAPASKPPRQTTRPKTQVTSAQAKKSEELYPEIEHIPVYHEPEDTFEDVWSVSERPDSYITQLLDWRPQRFSPYVDPPEEGNDLLLTRGSEDSSMEDIHIQDLTVEDPELGPQWQETPDDLLLPPLDDPFSDDNDESLNMLK